MGWFLCNGDTGLIWQTECTVKVNLNLEIFLIVARSKKKMGKHNVVDTAFQTGMMQSCCYLAPKKTLICNQLIRHFINLKIILGNYQIICLYYLDMYKHSLVSVPRTKCS